MRKQIRKSVDLVRDAMGATWQSTRSSTFILLCGINVFFVVLLGFVFALGSGIEDFLIAIFSIIQSENAFVLSHPGIQHNLLGIAATMLVLALGVYMAFTFWGWAAWRIMGRLKKMPAGRSLLAVARQNVVWLIILVAIDLIYLFTRLPVTFMGLDPTVLDAVFYASVGILFILAVSSYAVSGGHVVRRCFRLLARLGFWFMLLTLVAAVLLIEALLRLFSWVLGQSVVVLVVQVVIVFTVLSFLHLMWTQGVVRLAR
ncbi:MAG: hypothetical protein ACOCWQ_02120 [Nanoarchaeota archaeon]